MAIFNRPTGTPQSGSQSSLRQANRKLLFETVRSSGGMTQVELADNTGLSAATVSNLVRQLVDDGLFERHQTVRSGRRAVLVTLKHQLGVTIGLSVSRHALDLVILDSSASILTSHSLPISPQVQPDQTLERAVLLTRETLDSLDISLSEILGATVAMEAPVSKKTQHVAVPDILPGWENTDIRSIIARSFSCHVSVQNSAHMQGVAEHHFGAAQGINNFLYINIGDGVGSAEFINGGLLRGVTGFAGEIGHIQVDPLGAICQCGNRGCLNTIVNERHLTSLLAVTHGAITLTDLIRLAGQGDPGCRRIVEDVAVRVSSVVADSCITLDPHLVILGGIFMQTGDLFLRPFRENLRRLLLPSVLIPIEVRPATAPAPTAALGAAMTALIDSGMPMQSKVAHQPPTDSPAPDDTSASAEQPTAATKGADA